MIHEPQQKAQACIIWMHGLGAGAEDMMGLAHALKLAFPVRHVSLQAPLRPVTINNRMVMPAWYDITGVRITDREDREGISDSEATIHEVIESELKKGIKTECIFLAGFSQGGALALYTGLQYKYELGGIIALSAYLPMAAACTIRLDTQTPIFMALGNRDPIVLPAWTRQAVDLLRSKGFAHVALREYAMEHAVCAEEITELASWLTLQLERERSE